MLGIRSSIKEFPYLVVGAGLFGLTIAERIATQLNKPVCIIDKRHHSGGNCHSRINSETGIEIHQYGTHIFHTKNDLVWNYITQFTEFTNYRHRVRTKYNGKSYGMPIGLETINSFYDIDLKPCEVDQFLNSQKDIFQEPKNLEEKAISLIGRPLYEAFIRGYTLKQWQQPCHELPPDIISRLPIRTNYNPDYFTDPYQGIPKNGYFNLFQKMLESKYIDLRLDTEFNEIRNEIDDSTLVIYTGPIDQYFDERFGTLEYRTLRFENEILNYQDYQGIAVMNYANSDIGFTRIHEFKHLHPERTATFTSGKTIISREYSVSRGSKGQECFYPVNTMKNQKILETYIEASKPLKNVIFGGRLGQYKYLDMDQTIASALHLFDQISPKNLS